MSPADDIRALRDRTVAEMNAILDYLYPSEVAWDLAAQTLSRNPPQTYHNPETGVAVTSADLLTLSAQYRAQQLLEATFLQFFTVFEVFVGDRLRLWLTAHPRAIGGKTVELKDALDAGDLPALVAQLVDHEVAEVTYKSPRTVFQYLDRRLGFLPPAAADIEQLAEAKATRDVLVHNRGAVDAAYRLKAGALARHTVGQQIDLPKVYYRNTAALLTRLAADLSAAALAKAP